jgi:hypothetical protein
VDDLPDRVLVGLNQPKITGTVFRPAEASTTMARRDRIGEPVPLRVILSSC